jgi:hypothetical protein
MGGGGRGMEEWEGQRAPSGESLKRAAAFCCRRLALLASAAHAWQAGDRAAPAPAHRAPAAASAAASSSTRAFWLAKTSTSPSSMNCCRRPSSQRCLAGASCSTSTTCGAHGLELIGCVCGGGDGDGMGGGGGGYVKGTLCCAMP